MLCGGTINSHIQDIIESTHKAIMEDNLEYSFTTEKKELLSYVRYFIDEAYHDMLTGDEPLSYFYTYAKLWHFYQCVQKFYWLTDNEKSKEPVPDNPYRKGIVEELNKELLRLWYEAKRREKYYEDSSMGSNSTGN